MFKSTQKNNKPENIVARTKPYLTLCPKRSLIAPIASGPKAAPAAVKKRIIPAIEPCLAFGKQLIPFEFRVG